MLPLVMVVSPSTGQGPGLSESEGSIEVTHSSAPVLQMGTLRLTDT